MIDPRLQFVNMMFAPAIAVFLFSVNTASAAVSQQAYTWKNVKIGGGGGFVPNIVFNPSEK
jgi:xyloglucan-specific exo-beta-1,4-glucanase